VGFRKYVYGAQPTIAFDSQPPWGRVDQNLVGIDEFIA
jgi:hypothetical protein